MANLYRANKNVAIAKFAARDLSAFAISAYAVRVGKNTFINFGLPTLTFRHEDTKTFLDIAQAIKLIVNWGAKQKDQGNPRWIANTETPIFAEDGSGVKLYIFKYRVDTFLEARIEDDGYVRYTVMGHYFSDDFASAVKYVAALERFPQYAKRLDEEIAKNKLISIPYPKKASARTPYGAVTYELD